MCVLVDAVVSIMEPHDPVARMHQITSFSSNQKPIIITRLLQAYRLHMLWKSLYRHMISVPQPLRGVDGQVWLVSVSQNQVRYLHLLSCPAT